MTKDVFENAVQHSLKHLAVRDRDGNYHDARLSDWMTNLENLARGYLVNYTALGLDDSTV